MHDAGSIPYAEPLAFFLTWTTYGSWLPGDRRGWVDGRGGMHVAEPPRTVLARRRMAEEPLALDVDQRAAVAEAITTHGRVRGWHIHAVECRTQHTHVVVTAVGRDPDDVMRQFKSWATRALRRHAGEQGCSSRTRWWTEGGSGRWIFRERDLAAVVAYVKECQGFSTREAPSAG